MVREYIGARYVPKFMGTYDASQSYEALCVVDNGAGTTYITKIPTPPGTPLTDTEYWAVYGASSGAILDLQNRVASLENDFAELPIPRKVLLFGDSYMMGIGGNNNHDVELEIESRTGWDVQTFAEGGLGYIRANGDNHKCIDMVNDAISTITDKDSVTDCVLACSAYNEYGMIGQSTFSETGFYNAIKECVDALKAAFTNARISIAPAIWCGYTYNSNFSDISRWEVSAAKKLGLHFAKSAINWLMAYDNVTHSDNAHPNHDGYVIIADNIASMLNGTEPLDFYYSGSVPTNTNDTLYIMAAGNKLIIQGNVNLESGQTFTSLADLPSCFKNITNYPIYMKNYADISGDNDITGMIMQGGSGPFIYMGSSALIEGNTYIIYAEVPIVPYNPL